VDATVELRKSGKTLTGLTATDFTLTEDDQPQAITSVSEDTLPLSLLLLFDLTDTVHPVLIHLSAAADAVLHHLRPQDELAVMTFSSTTRLVQTFTRDRMSAVEGIDDASASYDRNEPTFIFEDLWQASAQSSRSRVPDARRVQIWLTDGSANDQDTQRTLAHHAPTQLHTQQQATDALLRSGAVVSTLIERTPDSLSHNSGHFGDLEHFAEATGGPTLSATATDVDKRLASLLDTLRQRYTLGYRPSQSKPDGTLCHLHLALSPAFYTAHPEFRPKDLLVRSRTKYMRTPAPH
jgi:VWFA-related protein